jgi:dihydroxyacetone kinase phosphoprotein-dependent L subunit
VSDSTLAGAQILVRRLADVTIENEAYFCELDAVVGDGDLGFSLGRGFEKLLESWDELEYDDVSGLLIKTATVLSGRMGGTSGPLWGTAFLRAGAALKGIPAPTGPDLVGALRAAIEGIKQRGKAELGDKTLLDALVPAVDRLAAGLDANETPAVALAAAASTARAAAEATRGMLAKRGRAAYSGERSRESADAGAIAVAVIFEALSMTLNEMTTT